jgi:hypothetical protein
MKWLVYGLLTIMASVVPTACSSGARLPRLTSAAVMPAFGDSREEWCGGVEDQYHYGKDGI